MVLATTVILWYGTMVIVLAVFDSPNVVECRIEQSMLVVQTH